MITVEKAEPWRCCNVCYEHNNVYNIVFRYQCTNQGTQISLCNKCIKDLAQKLNCSVFPNGSDIEMREE